MRVYFTGMPLATSDYLRLMRGRHVMYSFPCRGRAAYRELSRFSSVVLDSGAYSVWRRGLRIDLGAYADYCHSVSARVEWYASLDVIGDWRAGEKNLAAMEARGLAPVPVYHLGEPWGLLEDLVSAYERVALGRGSGMTFRLLWRLLEETFARTSDEAGTPLVRFHGFRMTDRRLMRRFPFESVDSTTWIAGSAWDALPTDTGRARGFSFLSDVEKARVWLSFFDSAGKAAKFVDRQSGCFDNSEFGPEEDSK